MDSNLPITLFAFLLTLGMVVIVHELGHFLFCKLFGVYVKTFSIGIGPKFARKRWGETEYVLSLIPFGGYVKMAGEGLMEEIQDTGTWEERKFPMGTEEGNREAEALDEDIPDERKFDNRPAWQRLLVFIAGPLFNLILAFVIYSGMAWSGGLLSIPFTTIGEVGEGSPAAEAGLRVGDRILGVDGALFEDWSSVIRAILPPDDAAEPPAPVRKLLIERDGQTLTVDLRPVPGSEYGDWSIGLEPWNTTVGLVQKGGPAAELGLQRGDVITEVDGKTVTSFNGIAGIVRDAADRAIMVKWLRDGVPMSGMVTPRLTEVDVDKSVGLIFIEQYAVSTKVSLGDAVRLGGINTLYVINRTLGSLRDFVERKVGLDAVGGPLRIGQAAGEQLRWSFGHLMYFVAFFSVNLFLLNLMPIPVLDGGHVLFLILEVVRGGRPVPQRLQAIATQMGLIILLLFMTFVIVLDVWKVTGH